MTFENMDYIRKRIEAGNDLSPKHGMILLSEIDAIKSNYLILFDALKIIADDETDYPKHVAQRALDAINQS